MCNVKCNLKHLVIDNCNITHLSDLDGYDEILIQNCPFLQNIDSISNVQKLSIINCTKLFSIDTIDDVQMMHIDRCDSVRRIRNIEAHTLILQYCFNIMSIDPLLIQKLTIRRCPFISHVALQPNLKHLVIDHCASLDTLQFTCDTPFCYSGLKIELFGDNMIKYIKDWYVSELLIHGSSYIEYVSNVYNVSNLSIIDCCELSYISETYIIDTLEVHACPALDMISNVYGFRKLTLIDCDELEDFDIQYSSLEKVIITSCKLLNTQFNGTSITELTLMDTGFIIINDLSKNAIVNIKDASLLPNLTSTTNTLSLDEQSSFNIESLKLSYHIQHLFKSARTITNCIMAYKIRKTYLTYLRHKAVNNIDDCVICQESIAPNQIIFTKCNHMFHSGCLHEWLKIRRSCPLCNNSL